jgi:NAD(P)-dependent dehydrogenase (short-subunit alcohol dehydrogenase family)
MTTLVVGASGATGRLLVEQLCHRGQNVRVIVRSPNKLPETLRNHDNVTVIEGSILELSDVELSQHVSGCVAVASCLGHNISVKGIFGQPRRLVTDATRRLCDAIAVADGKPFEANKSGKPTKFVLMNTAGNSNRDLHEPISFSQQCVMGLIRLLLPPHADNEAAADYLRTNIGQNNEAIEWAVVRPDSLIDADRVTQYEVYASPTRSAIFDAGVTSRINVAHFMADLITSEDTWNKWKGEMPVIYNKEA